MRPSSTRAPTVAAVKAFVTDPMANNVSGVTGSSASRSRLPHPAARTTSPPPTAATAHPGTSQAASCSATNRSMLSITCLRRSPPRDSGATIGLRLGTPDPVGLHPPPLVRSVLTAGFGAWEVGPLASSGYGQGAGAGARPHGL